MTVPQRGIHCSAVHASPSPAVFLAAGRGAPTRGLLCQGMRGFAYKGAPTWTSACYPDYEGSKNRDPELSKLPLSGLMAVFLILAGSQMSLSSAVACKSKPQASKP